MHATDFGRTLIIANPAAQSGARASCQRLHAFGHDCTRIPV
ncbi:MAG: hypothetical protein ACLU37_08800 [Collinsella sp.]